MRKVYILKLGKNIVWSTTSYNQLDTFKILYKQKGHFFYQQAFLLVVVLVNKIL